MPLFSAWLVLARIIEIQRQTIRTLFQALAFNGLTLFVQA